MLATYQHLRILRIRLLGTANISLYSNFSEKGGSARASSVFTNWRRGETARAASVAFVVWDWRVAALALFRIPYADTFIFRFRVFTYRC